MKEALKALDLNPDLYPMAEALAALKPEAYSDEEVCRVDPNLLAALIENRLEPEQRRSVLTQIADSPMDLKVLAMTLQDMVADAAEAPAQPQKSRKRYWAPLSALAAAALIGAFLLVPSRNTNFQADGPMNSKLWGNLTQYDSGSVGVAPLLQSLAQSGINASGRGISKIVIEPFSAAKGSQDPAKMRVEVRQEGDTLYIKVLPPK